MALDVRPRPRVGARGRARPRHERARRRSERSEERRAKSCTQSTHHCTCNARAQCIAQFEALPSSERPMCALNWARKSHIGAVVGVARTRALRAERKVRCAASRVSGALYQCEDVLQMGVRRRARNASKRDASLARHRAAECNLVSGRTVGGRALVLKQAPRARVSMSARAGPGRAEPSRTTAYKSLRGRALCLLMIRHKLLTAQCFNDDNKIIIITFVAIIAIVPLALCRSVRLSVRVCVCVSLGQARKPQPEGERRPKRSSNKTQQMDPQNAPLDTQMRTT